MKGTVLVVEDDADVRAAIADTLRDEGLEVATAEHATDALAYLDEHPAPQLILLDLVMPVMDGYEFLKTRRRDPKLGAIPVVALTASKFTASDKLVLARLGVQMWLSKPIERMRASGAVVALRLIHRDERAPAREQPEREDSGDDARDDQRDSGARRPLRRCGRLLGDARGLGGFRGWCRTEGIDAARHFLAFRAAQLAAERDRSAP